MRTGPAIVGETRVARDEERLLLGGRIDRLERIVVGLGVLEQELALHRLVPRGFERALSRSAHEVGAPERVEMRVGVVVGDDYRLVVRLLLVAVLRMVDDRAIEPSRIVAPPEEIGLEAVLALLSLGVEPVEVVLAVTVGDDRPDAAATALTGCHTSRRVVSAKAGSIARRISAVPIETPRVWNW